MIRFDKNVKSSIYSTISDYLETEFSYIECQEDIYDLENYNCDDDLYNDAFNEGMFTIKDNIDEYDFENNEEEITEALSFLVGQVFDEVKEEMLNRLNEKFEMEDMLYEMDEYDED